MKPRTGFWLAAGAVVCLSLAPRLALGWLRTASPAPPTRIERLRRFLVATGAGPVSAIVSSEGGTAIVGWRFGAGRCAAFPSGPHGTFDSAARAEAHAMGGARLTYVWRGALSARPPAWPLALEVIAYRATAALSPSRADEPGYVVLVSQGGCQAATALPWGRFRA